MFFIDHVECTLSCESGAQDAMCEWKAQLCMNMHARFYIFVMEDQSAYSMLCSTFKVAIAIKCDWSCLQGKTCVMVYGNGFA